MLRLKVLDRPKTDISIYSAKKKKFASQEDSFEMLT